MATMKIKGVSEYLKALSKMEKSAEGTIKKAVYEGARVIAEACAKNINDLPTTSGWGTEENPLNSLKPSEKLALIQSFGLSKMKNENGYINTKAGFSGYNGLATKKHPQGAPNVIVARAVESGTSFRVKHPFIRPAVNGSKNKAIYSMDKQLEEDLKFLGF